MEHKDNYDRLLPMPVKLGFGIANLGDTVITEFVGAFFIFFLTNIAGVRPALAGTIVFLGVMWGCHQRSHHRNHVEPVHTGSRAQTSVPADIHRAPDPADYHDVHKSELFS